MTRMISAVLASVLVASSASAMTAGEFLTKAEALKKKGMFALMSSDVRLLSNQVRGDMGQLRAERLAKVKTGTKPDYCPPEKSGLHSDELLNAFRAVPVAQRGTTSVKSVLFGLMKRKYPCRA